MHVYLLRSFATCIREAGLLLCYFCSRYFTIQNLAQIVRTFYSKSIIARAFKFTFLFGHVDRYPADTILGFQKGLNPREK